MRKHGFALLELTIAALILAIIAMILIPILSRPAEAQTVDPRAPVIVTGVTTGPSHGANSWPHTGVTIGLPLFKGNGIIDTPGMDEFLDAVRNHARPEAALEFPEPEEE